MTRMNDFNLVICIGIFQCRTDLFASDIKFVTIVLVKVAGQGAEGALGGESEGGSHFGFVLSPATVVRLTVVDSVLNPLRFEEP